MSETAPQRPMMDDEFHRAYARARGLVDGSPGPAAAVRANVLAQARGIAAQVDAARLLLAAGADPDRADRRAVAGAAVRARVPVVTA